MSQAMRKLSARCRGSTTAIFINQLREKIGVMFGNPETTPGGRAEVLLLRPARRAEGREPEGRDRRGRSRGTSQGREEQGGAAVPPVRVRHHVRLRHLEGGSLLDVGVDLEIVKKSGAWFTYEGDQLGQAENARQFRRAQDIATELERRVREAVGLTAFGAEGDETPIEVVPDLVVTDEPAPKAAKADKERETTGARAG